MWAWLLPLAARGFAFAVVAPLPVHLGHTLRFRLVMGVVLTIALAPLGGQSAPAGVSSTAAIIPLCCREGLLGLCLGLIVAVIVSGVHVMGGLLAAAFGTGGLMYGQGKSAWDELGRWLGWLLFFLVDGHRAVLDAMLSLPLGGGPVTSARWAETIVQLTGQMLVVGWQLALPVVLAQWTAQLGLIALGRIVPALADWGLCLSVVTMVLLAGAAWSCLPVAHYATVWMHEQLLRSLQQLGEPAVSSTASWLVP